MNLRKLFALLMTAVMLLGMVPAGHAEGGNMMPGGEFTVSCNHNWAWRWPNGQPAHCQDWKLSEEYCTKCGAVNGSYEQCGPCQPGSWYWDGNPPASCNEWGIQNQLCSVCGEPFNEREVRGDHQWGAYRTVEPAGCETPGLEVSYCLFCGESGAYRETPAKGHDWGEWKWEFEPSCNQEGLRVRYCKRCNMREEDYAQGGVHRWGSWNTISSGNCQTPAREQRTCSVCGATETRDGAYGGHKWGEWFRNGIPTCMQEGVMCRICELCGIWETDSIPKVSHNFGEWYVVVEAQVGLPGVEQRDCTYGCGTFEQREIPALEQDFGNSEFVSAAGLELTLVLSSTPANGSFFVPGEEVTFTETWANNTDQTLYPFSVSIFTSVAPVYGSEVDQICSWFAEDAGGPVAPGASGSHTLTVTVTEADVARGAIYAMAELLSTVQDGPEVEDVKTPFVTAPCGMGEQPGDNDASAVLKIETVPITVPSNGNHYVAGEAVILVDRFTNLSDTLTLTGSNWMNVEIRGLGTFSPAGTFEDDAVLGPGEMKGLLTSEYVITEEDVAQGYIQRTIHAAFTDENDYYYIVTYKIRIPCGVGELPDDYVPPMNSDGVRLEKFIRNAPANGEYYVSGEVLNYALTLRIDDGLLLDDAAIYDPIIDNDGLVISYGKGLYGGMGMDVFYTVTEEDVQRGYVENTAYATWIYSDSGKPGYCESETVIAPCGPDNSGDYGLSAALSVTKSVTSTPANGRYYEPGEDITFVITVSNQGSEQLLNVNVIDPLGGGLVTVLETLNVGETRDITVVFTTTDIVAWAGSVDNGACVKAVDKNGRQYVEYSNIVTVPCGHTFYDITIKPDDPFGIFDSLAVIKKEESLPLNGEYYTEGEVIHYSITYTNDGELPLTDVQIWDVLDVTTPVASAEMLNPGESRICYYQHTVTAEDVAAGTVMNIAHASYPVPNYAGFANSTSNVVISKTSADEKGDTPPFGTIDTDSLHGDDNYCVRTITGRDNVSATYETDFCSVHTPIQASALMMKQAAVTPETQMQAAAYAVALWRTEVEKLYQEIFKAADPTAKTVVMTEYIRFLTEVANYETMLKVLYPDQPALVALKVADIWENKCVDLCYDAHAAAAERKDSLLAVTPAAGASAAECTCVTTAETNGQKTDVQSYCPAHSFPFGMIDMLLQGNDTAESWTMVRQIWGVELTSAYNKLYTAMGDNKLLAMAEYNALTQWMMAREATLIALYPDHPEIAAQIMVKTIMERVNALCSAVK